MLIKIFLIFSFISSPAALSAQTDETLRLWASRPVSITNNIATDINKLEGLDKSLGYARLGEAWWKQDEKIGREWLSRSIDYATGPASLFKDDKERISTLRILLKIVSNKDADYARTLIRKITNLSSEMAGNEKEEDENNDAILKAASEMVSVDAVQAHSIALATLKAKRPSFSFSAMLFTLRLATKNQLLANQFFAAAVDVARARSVSKMYERLIRTAFPDSLQESFTTPITESNRRILLEALSIQFSIESMEALERRGGGCTLTAFFAPRIRPHYEATLPEKLSLLDQSVRTCQAGLPASSDKDPASKVSPKSLDEVLKIAESTANKEKKAELLLLAAGIALTEKNYQVAFDTLLTVDEKHRSKPLGVWEDYLISAVYPMIIEGYKANDFATSNRFFVKVPLANRPLARMAVANHLDKVTSKLLIKELLDVTRKELAEISFEIPKGAQVLQSSPQLYTDVIGVFRKIGFDLDAIETYDESILAINRFLSQVSPDERNKVIPLIPVAWSSFSTFDGTFLDTHFLRLEHGISKIEYPPIRRELEFAWLKSTLKRFSEIRDEFDKRKKLTDKNDEKVLAKP